jgi:hypothetical protein
MCYSSAKCAIWKPESVIWWLGQTALVRVFTALVEGGAQVFEFRSAGWIFLVRDRGRV